MPHRLGLNLVTLKIKVSFFQKLKLKITHFRVFLLEKKPICVYFLKKDLILRKLHILRSISNDGNKT